MSLSVEEGSLDLTHVSNNVQIIRNGGATKFIATDKDGKQVSINKLYC